MWEGFFLFHSNIATELHQSIFHSKQSLTLESGIRLPAYHLAYTTYGKLNDRKDNVVWIFHALTANSNPHEWWPGLVGEGKLFNPEKDYIVCVNMPGSCYGSIGPLEKKSENGQIYFHEFPFFTTRDMIRTYQPLREFLGIEKIRIGIGGSMGGQQLLEWAITEPDLFENIIPIATNARHSAWGIAYNASQRMSIETDATWKENTPLAGIEGMKVARSMALLSYRHYDTYHISQGEHHHEKLEHYKSESYQKYQGEKLSRRFNAFSYYFLSKSMDAHNVGRGYESIEMALHKIQSKTLVIGIETDNLFPLIEQKFIAQNIPGSSHEFINSLYGHDGFLLEYEKIENIIQHFLK